MHVKFAVFQNFLTSWLKQSLEEFLQYLIYQIILISFKYSLPVSKIFSRILSLEFKNIKGKHKMHREITAMKIIKLQEQCDTIEFHLINLKRLNI